MPTLVHLASGAILESHTDDSSGQMAAPAGTKVFKEYYRPSDYWYDGSKFKRTEVGSLTLPATDFVVGETLTLTKPADAWVDVGDLPLTNASSITLPSTPGSLPIQLVGRYAATPMAVINILASMASIKTTLLDGIDARREPLEMLNLTGGGAKKFIYAMKYLEYRETLTLTSVIFTGLSLNDKAAKFPFIWAAAQEATGKAQPSYTEFIAAATVIGAAAVPIVTAMAKVDAKAVAAKAKVRAATTSAAARTAAAAPLT